MAVLLLLTTTRCSDDSVSYYSISGTITYPGESGSANAAGAVAYLAKTSGGPYDMSTVADADGLYTFDNMEAGTYYLNASYYTDNNNTGARLEGVVFTTGGDIEVVVGSANVTENVTLVSSGQTTTDVIDLDYDARDAGRATADLGTWTFDGNHSVTEFAFDFDEGNAEFTGSFSRVTKAEFNFDPANLSASSISGEIDLLSVNTRTRGGRDPLWDGDYSTLNDATVFTETNCVAHTFGIWEDATLPATVTDPQRYASFASTSIEKYGDGYIAKGNMTFSAVMDEAPATAYGVSNNPNTSITKPVSIIFKYRPGWQDNTRYYSSVEAKMVFDAKADFDIFSGHVLDQQVKVYLNIQMRKNK